MINKTNQKAQNLVDFPQYQATLAETQTGAPFIQYNLDVTPDSQWFIAHTNPKARARLPYVQEVGEFVTGKNYMTTRQGLQSYLLKITLDGQGYINFDGKHYTLSPGQFFWIDCRKLNYYAIDPDIPHWNVIWMHFWGNSTHDYYDSFMELNNNSPIGTMRNSDAVQLLRKLIGYYSTYIYSDYQTDIKAASIITTLMTCCMESAIHDKTMSLKKQPPKFGPRAQEYITEHFNERITLDSLAEEFYVNKFYLQKQFRLYVGSTPGEFQRSIRIDKAKELLRVTTMSINDISEHLGFESVGYFIRCFKKEDGKTPLQYRREWGV